MQLFIKGILIFCVLVLFAVARVYYWWKDSHNPAGMSTIGPNMREKLNSNSVSSSILNEC